MLKLNTATQHRTSVHTHRDTDTYRHHRHHQHGLIVFGLQFTSTLYDYVIDVMKFWVWKFTKCECLLVSMWPLYLFANEEKKITWLCSAPFIYVWTCVRSISNFPWKPKTKIRTFRMAHTPCKSLLSAIIVLPGMYRCDPVQGTSFTTVYNLTKF